MICKNQFWMFEPWNVHVWRHTLDVGVDDFRHQKSIFTTIAIHIDEPRHEKNCIWGLPPDSNWPTLSYRDMFESWNFVSLVLFCLGTEK